MSGDYLGRLQSALDGRQRVRHALSESHPDMVLVDEPDLRAALKELDDLRAERELLGAGEAQQRIVTPGGLIYPPSERDLAMRGDWLPSVRLEQRTVYGTPWVNTVPQQDEHGRGEEPT